MNAKEKFDQMQVDLVRLHAKDFGWASRHLRFEMNQKTLTLMSEEISVQRVDGAIDYSHAFGYKILINDELADGVINLLVDAG